MNRIGSFDSIPCTIAVGIYSTTAVRNTPRVRAYRYRTAALFVFGRFYITSCKTDRVLDHQQGACLAYILRTGITRWTPVRMIQTTVVVQRVQMSHVVGKNRTHPIHDVSPLSRC